MAENVKHVKDDSFAKEVVEASKEKPVLVDFWAPWCGPCKALAPLLEDIEPEVRSRITLTKIDVDENPETPGTYGVRGIPTLIIFKDGEPVATKVGSMSEADLSAFIESNIKAKGAAKDEGYESE